MSGLMKGKFGRCAKKGHGQDCHVSKDIQQIRVPRTTDKANAMKEVSLEIDQYFEANQADEKEDNRK